LAIKGEGAMDRLSEATRQRLPSTARLSGYRRQDLCCGIVHVGVGAFHRAHQAVYTELALEHAFGPWGICGVSLRRPEIRDRLAPQDGLYTVAERDTAVRLQVIGCLKQLLVAPEDPAAVIERIAAPATAIVSLTVTEKGYCHDPASGRLDWSHADIRHDVAEPDRPASAVGMLVAGLARRRERRVAPPTIMSCDNLPANGQTLRGLVIALAARRDEALARWIEAEVAFPCSMVDRIVPATTAADIVRIGQALGVHDAAPVVCEPFRQWVIEDRFAGPRPAWELAGAELVAKVGPYEEMKLRLLNGSHSAIAYLGCLAGFEHVFDVMAEPDFVTFVREMMAEATPTLHVPGDLAAYQAALIARFANPSLAHRTSQIAMDGSQKLPQRLLGTIRERLCAGAPIDRLSLAVAAWIRYASGRDEQGRAIEVADPLAGRLAAIGAAAGSDPVALARGFFELGEVFGTDLPRDERFTAAVTGWLASLLARGARATVADCVRGSRS
jgi:fructuronate reductase